MERHNFALSCSSSLSLSLIPIFGHIKPPTCDLGCKGASSDVLVIKLDDYIIVSWGHWHVGHSAGAIFIILTADLCFRRAFHCQRQTSWEKMREQRGKSGNVRLMQCDCEAARLGECVLPSPASLVTIVKVAVCWPCRDSDQGRMHSHARC